MQLEIVSTGDEVITGFITDTNVSFLSQELLSLGLQPYRRHTVGDRLEDITALLTERSREADIILVNGGLGPTSDDNTTEAAARAAGVKQVLNETWLERLKAWHQARNRQMPQSNIKQAMLPEGAVMIDNPRGTACGFYLKINKATCFFTPGVPSEFKGMYFDAIKPYLIEHLGLSSGTKVRRFFSFGVSESKIGQTLNAYSLPPSLVLGYRAAYPLIEIKLIEHNATAAEEQQGLEIIRRELKPYLILEDDFNLAQRIAELSNNEPFMIFDSATAGVLAEQLAAHVNIEHALISRSDCALSSSLRSELTAKCRYVYTVNRSDDGNGQNFILEDLRAGRRWHYHSSLNVTLKEKKREAIALTACTLLYQTLAGLPPIQPDGASLCLIED